VLIGLSLVCVAPSGCVTVQSAASMSSTIPDGLSRTAPHEAESVVWPARWGDGAPGIGKGVVVAVDGPLRAWYPRRHGSWHRRLPKEGDEAIVRALAAGRAGEAGYQFRLEGEGAFIFQRDSEVPAPKGARGRDEPSFMFVFASGRVAERRADEPRVEVQRTWFAYYDHRRGGSAEPGDPGEGVVMLLPGLFGVPEGVVDVMVATMRQRGWNVVRMLAPPAGFVARSDLKIDSGAGAEASAREAASELMDRVAETAYAAEGAIGHVLARRPALSDRPKVILGGSAGALALPAAVMRTPGVYDAAVLIAGGANLLEIVTRSSYTGPVEALEFEWTGFDGTPDRGALERVASAYLAHAPLDAGNAAAALHGTPVLMLQATADDAIPPDTGDRLWRALGEPERWLVSGNHLTLFMSLWLYTPRIMDWVEANAGGVDP